MTDALTTNTMAKALTADDMAYIRDEIRTYGAAPGHSSTKPGLHALKMAVGEIERLNRLHDTLHALVAADSAARDNLRNQLAAKDDEIDRLRAERDAMRLTDEERQTLRGIRQHLDGKHWWRATCAVLDKLLGAKP